MVPTDMAANSDSNSDSFVVVPAVVPVPTKRTATTRTTTNTSAFSRAQRLAEISVGTLVGPLTVALFKTGLPRTQEEWNLFWELPVDDGSSSLTLAQQVTCALEDMGPTFVKFGQSMAARPDIVPRSLAVALSTLQDQMQPFDTQIAKTILETELMSKKTNKQDDCQAILASLSETPVAAASIGQVYSARLANQQKVAIKVQRPGIRDVVEQDSALLLQVAKWLESLPDPRQQQERFIRTNLSGAIQEFMTRLREELDYRNEANNLEIFASLYSHRRVTNTSVQVVVPEVYDELCTENVLVMEWLDGTKLVDLETEESSRESLALIEEGIDCTLSQLLETGILHADAHSGNLLKVQEPSSAATSADSSKNSPTQQPRLGYVDFGLLATVPVQVRDGLVCAVAELVFERNVTAVAQLFGELALIPDSVLQNPSEMEALGQELEAALVEVLVYPSGDTSSSSSSPSSSTIPQLRFDKLLNVLSRLVPRFQFELPPYFLNNARSLGTLEGMAREIQPTFNVLQFLYPYALQRIVANPSQSPVVETTLNHLLTHPESGRIDRQKIRRLTHDVTLLTGYSKTRLLRDVLASPNGPQLVRRVVGDSVLQIARRKKRGSDTERRHSRKHRRRQSGVSSDFFRL